MSMDVVRFDLSHMPEKRENLSLALGHFDGLHKGHQALFVETSLNASGDAGALLFALPYGEGPHLTSVEDKIRFAGNSRLDVLYVLDNDEGLFRLQAREFIEKILLPLGVKRVVVGQDFRFGYQAQGDVALLQEYFEVSVIDMVGEKGKKISSRDIKALLREGHIDEANECLGKPYEVSGIVKEGLHNGEKLGFKTANIALSYDYVLPKNGVYCGVCYVSGVAYRAMINVGVNPTVGALEKPIIEAHLLDYDKDCYGKRIYCAFLAFLREERKFDSLEKLAEQLTKDEAAVRMLLG